ncbi:hypothetical protein AB1Y20_009182 [Prymnesium parvum]|uniref:Uncharacterized protein n=1 Tax=Prymnesium parvum TaxID=97485 RepID=A0AB34K5X2_PRYPA
MAAFLWLASLLPPPHTPPLSHRGAARPHASRGGVPACLAGRDAHQDAQAAQELMRSPRATQGVEAFAGTAWQVLFEMDEGGVAMFTVELMEDLRCRFSDKDEYGEWKAEKDWLVFEKPRGLFEETLYLTAQLQLGDAEQRKHKLVRGVAHIAESADGSDPDDPNREVKLKRLGTFGAIEYDDR